MLKTIKHYLVNKWETYQDNKAINFVLVNGGDNQTRGYALYLHFIGKFQKISNKKAVTKYEYEILVQYMLASCIDMADNRADMNEIIGNVVRGAKNVRKMKMKEEGVH